MSYHTWSIDGLGFCVDDIKTTPERVLKLAASDEDVLSSVREYLDMVYTGGYQDTDIQMHDFDEFEGDGYAMGLSAIIQDVITDELPVTFAEDFDCNNFILYTPTYPWHLTEKEKSLTPEDIVNILQKYISILTDEHVSITYYSVENGG